MEKQKADEICSDILSELYSSMLKCGEVNSVEGYVWRISKNVYSKYVALKKKNQGICIESIDDVEICGVYLISNR